MGPDHAALQNKNQSKCKPGVCFTPAMCIETAEGVDCAPCPEGYTGDGVQCDDVDEVRFKIQIFLFMLLVNPNISQNFNNMNNLN